ncbi:MAG: hypothetical protein MR428_00345 [Mesosutterella sp.]|nr:hypothetical protein [Mesosutterella sp.]
MSENNKNYEIKELSFRDVAAPFCKAFCLQFMAKFTDIEPETRRASCALVSQLTALGGVPLEGAARPSDLGKKIYDAFVYLESLNNEKARQHAKALANVSAALAGFSIYAGVAHDLMKEQQQHLPAGHC